MFAQFEEIREALKLLKRIAWFRNDRNHAFRWRVRSFVATGYSLISLFGISPHFFVNGFTLSPARPLLRQRRSEQYQRHHPRFGLHELALRFQEELDL